MMDDASAGQYSEAAWCAVELEKASGTQADAEAAALLETASQRRAALMQVDLLSGFIGLKVMVTGSAQVTRWRPAEIPSVGTS